MGQTSSEGVAPLVKTGFDSPDGDLQFGRRFSVGQPLQVEQERGLALPRGEHVDGTTDLFGHERRLGKLVGAWSAVNNVGRFDQTGGS